MIETDRKHHHPAGELTKGVRMPPEPTDDGTTDTGKTGGGGDPMICPPDPDADDTTNTTTIVESEEPKAPADTVE